MKELTDTIELTLTKEDFVDAPYVDPWNCPIAKAIKRSGYNLTEGSGGGVGPSTARIQDVLYRLVGDANHKVHDICRGTEEFESDFTIILKRD
jgi:hypothetical protein